MLPTKTHDLAHSVLPMEEEIEFTKGSEEVRERDVLPMPFGENFLASGGKDRNITQAKLRNLDRRIAILDTLLKKPKKMMNDLGVKVKLRIKLRPQTKSPK